MADKEPHFHVFQFKNTLANSPFGFKPLNPSYSEEVDSILLGVWSHFFIQLIQRAIVCYEINLLSKSLQPCPLVILFGVGLGLDIRERKKKKKKKKKRKTREEIWVISAKVTPLILSASALWVLQWRIYIPTQVRNKYMKNKNSLESL